jgi:hypothetical protein
MMPYVGSAVDEMARQNQTKAPQQIAAVSVFLPLAMGAVALRMWIRTRMIKSLGWDDYMMVVALVGYGQTTLIAMQNLTVSIVELHHVRRCAHDHCQKRRRYASSKLR